MEFIRELTSFAEKLDQECLFVVAEKVDALSEALIKTAQYVGSQEYWIRNERCWSNCYRQKRASSPNKPAQEVWFECQSEYEKQTNDPSDSWSKYASSPINVKFAQQIEDAVKNNLDVDAAILETISLAKNEHHSMLKHASSQLLVIADDLDNVDHELAVRAASISAEMIKEAGPLGNIRDMGKALWQGTKDQFYNPPGQKSPGAGQGLWGRYRANQNISDQNRVNSLQNRMQDYQNKWNPTPANPAPAPNAVPDSGTASTGAPAPTGGAPANTPAQSKPYSDWSEAGLNKLDDNTLSKYEQKLQEYINTIKTVRATKAGTGNAPPAATAVPASTATPAPTNTATPTGAPTAAPSNTAPAPVEYTNTASEAEPGAPRVPGKGWPKKKASTKRNLFKI